MRVIIIKYSLLESNNCTLYTASPEYPALCTLYTARPEYPALCTLYTARPEYPALSTLPRP